MSKLEIQPDSGGRYTLSGEMSFESVPLALDESIHLFGEQPDIELDFSGVTSSDSAGLALLIEWLAWARRERRKLRYTHLPSQVLALARISDVENLLPAD